MPLAFLSYTRKDNEFFGGYVTAFRKMLENAVHVVTGDTNFEIFQDIDGIAIGEQWKKKLVDSAHRSSLFVPVLSPLFFNSKPCMHEVREFLKHERSLKRNDLILPIYFLTSPKLEKEEEKANDEIAQELSARQMVDWRKKVHVPLAKPAARQAILDLAGQVAEALNRTHVQQPKSTTRGAPVRAVARYRLDSTDPRLGVNVPATTGQRQLDSLSILWVDDRPANNIWERRALEGYGTRFTLARSTDEAKRLLSKKGPFAVIISDMGRPEDSKAGLTLLTWLRTTSYRDTPYFVYTSPIVAATLKRSRRAGLRGVTADPDTLVEMVLGAFK